MENNAPAFEIIHMSPENTNSILISSGDDAVIIDAWGRATAWEQLLRERNLTLRGIYSTHGHPDHISAAPDLSAGHGAPWYLNSADWNLVGWGNELLEYFGIPPITGDAAAPTDLTPGEYEILDGIKMHAIATPGHSGGGMAFWFPDFNILATGDTLFRDGVGRYDFPGGDMGALRDSITRIFNMNLPDETYVVHGHGMDSTIESLKKTNQYFNDGHACCGACHDDDAAHKCCHCGHCHKE